MKGTNRRPDNRPWKCVLLLHNTKDKKKIGIQSGPKVQENTIKEFIEDQNQWI